MVESKLLDIWKGKNTQHDLTGLLRQSIYRRLGGYEDTNDAPRLCVDPTMRQVMGERAKDNSAASTSQMGRFETQILTQPNNLRILMSLPGKRGDQIRLRRPVAKLTL